MATSIPALLRHNRNYRLLWFGQIVSEIGDHFNNIAVFSLAMGQQHGGLLVSGVLIARALPMLVAGPLAGSVLDHFDRRKVMIASDFFRAFVSLGFIFCVGQQSNTLLFALSALLMFASPFFSSGRNAILPIVAEKDELHAANTLTQTTAWATTAVGAFLGGSAVALFGYEYAFLLNATSFLLSGCSLLFFRSARNAFLPPLGGPRRSFHPVDDYIAGLRYLRSQPLLLAIALIGVGWATGGGAAQILFSVFGEKVFHRGPQGIGILWGAAGLGLVAGGILGNRLNQKIGFVGYKRAVSFCYVFHGSLYVAFALEPDFYWALLWIGLSRAAVAMSSVMNYSRMLTYVDDAFRGRVFATMETLTWGAMMVSMFGAGIATESVDPRTIGAVAGVLSSTTALWWAWLNVRGKLRLPVSHRS
jgi:predicted MFS family arabinose efflux permease